MFFLNCRYTIDIPVVWDTEHWLFLQLYKCKQHYQQQKMCRSSLIYVASKNSVSVKKINKNKKFLAQVSEEQDIILVWPYIKFLNFVLSPPGNHSVTALL